MNLHPVAYSSGNGKSRCKVCLASKSDLNSPKFFPCLQVNGHMLAQKTLLKQKQKSHWGVVHVPTNPIIWSSEFCT